MSRSTPKDYNRKFLCSTNIKQAFSLEHPRKSSRLAAKKATSDKSTAKQVLGESLVVTEPLTELAGTSVGYTACTLLDSIIGDAQDCVFQQ